MLLAHCRVKHNHLFTFGISVLAIIIPSFITYYVVCDCYILVLLLPYLILFIVGNEAKVLLVAIA